MREHPQAHPKIAVNRAAALKWHVMSIVSRVMSSSAVGQKNKRRGKSVCAQSAMPELLDSAALQAGRHLIFEAGSSQKCLLIMGHP